MRFTCHILALAGLIFLQAFSLNTKEDKPAQPINYPKVFGQDYQKAVSFVHNNPLSTIRFLNNGVSPALAWSVVFPELIRYNSIQDKAEVTSLYVLYVNFGNQYSDFSIGPFQMKPSFAERIEKEYLRNKEKFTGTDSFAFDTSETIQARSQRVSRLESTYWQTCYLILLIRYLDYTYRHVAGGSTTDKVLFYSSAYNCGYWKSSEFISQSIAKKQFHTGLTSPGAEFMHSYASIALYFYQLY